MIKHVLVFLKPPYKERREAPRYPHEPGTMFSLKGDAVQPKQCLLALRCMFTQDFNERQGLQIYCRPQRFTRRQQRRIAFRGEQRDAGQQAEGKMMEMKEQCL